MSNIQANLNQLLTMVAVGAKLAPGAETRAEIYGAKKSLASQKERASLIDKKAEKTPLTEAEIDIREELANEIVGASRKLFHAQPNEESYERYKNNLEEAGLMETSLEKEREQLPSYQARKRAEMERELKEEMRREEIRKSLLDWRN
jgi:hypothetical protein